MALYGSGTSRTATASSTVSTDVRRRRQAPASFLCKKGRRVSAVAKRIECRQREKKRGRGKASTVVALTSTPDPSVGVHGA